MPAREKNAAVYEEVGNAFAMCDAIILSPGTLSVSRGVEAGLGTKFEVRSSYHEGCRGECDSNWTAAAVCFPQGRLKMASVWGMNERNRALSLRQSCTELDENNLEAASSEQKSGFDSLVHQIQPFFPPHEQPVRLNSKSSIRNFLRVYQKSLHKSRGGGMVLTRAEEGEYSRFPGKKVGSVKVQHDSHIPKAMLIGIFSCPHYTSRFEGRAGIRRIYAIKSVQKTTARR